MALEPGKVMRNDVMFVQACTTREYQCEGSTERLPADFELEMAQEYQNYTTPRCLRQG